MKVVFLLLALLVCATLSGVSGLKRVRHHKAKHSKSKSVASTPVLLEEMAVNMPVTSFLTIQERQNNVDDLITQAKTDLADLLGVGSDTLELSGPPNSDENGDSDDTYNIVSTNAPTPEEQTATLEGLQSEIVSLVGQLKVEHSKRKHEEHALSGLQPLIDEVKGFLGQYSNLKKDTDRSMHGLMDKPASAVADNGDNDADDDMVSADTPYDESIEPLTTNSIGSEISVDQQRDPEPAPEDPKGLIIEVISDDNVKVAVQDDKFQPEVGSPSPYTTPCPQGADCTDVHHIGEGYFGANAAFVGGSHVLGANVVTSGHAVIQPVNSDGISSYHVSSSPVAHSTTTSGFAPIIAGAPVVGVGGSQVVGGMIYKNDVQSVSRHTVNGVTIGHSVQSTTSPVAVNVAEPTVVSTSGPTTASIISEPTGILSSAATTVSDSPNSNMEKVYVVNDGLHVHDAVPGAFTIPDRH